MTTTSTPSSNGAAASAVPSGPGAIARLHPYDGLFLRAEHLERLQSYTQELTRALGQAGGVGVVQGYGLTLSSAEARLEVGGGLAFAPNGQPLHMITGTSLKLDQFTADNGAWVVELKTKEEPFGDETVFGALCEDPCEGADASARPYVAELVEVHLHPFSPRAEPGARVSERRSRVAKAWFAAERHDAGALVVAASNLNQGRDGNFDVSAWSAPTGLPRSEVPGGFAEPNTVPIGVLLRVEDDWVVDTWIARRDRIDTPPRRAWEGRLGMRPWDVFVAQVLQFQVQLAEEWPTAATTFSGIATRQLVISDLDDALKTLRAGRRGGVTTLVSRASDRLKGKVARAATAVGTLVELGFVELPPAGFLPLPEGEGWTGRSVEEKVEDLIGDTLDLRFCACRPDTIAHAVEEAQHLERIPLVGDGPEPKVDILVPTDSGTWAGAGYGWVAFHRRRDRDCRVVDTRELVDVYVHETDEVETLRLVLLDGGRPERMPEPLTVPYPVGSWALPPADRQMVVDRATAKPGVEVVALSRSQQRARLIWVRAMLLANTFVVGNPRTTAVVNVVPLPDHEEIHIIVPDRVVDPG